jgi:hypothetical protein
MANLPYVQVIGTLEKILEKIKTASVPEKFSSDFVSTKLLMKGGNGRAVIPFIKRMGLVTPDGTPTDRYKEFRHPSKAGKSIANAMRELYEPLFEMNEYVHELDTDELKSLIVEATGAERTSTVVQKTLSTFQSLRKRAEFDEDNTTVLDNSTPISDLPEVEMLPREPIRQNAHMPNSGSQAGMNLSYTINLNLPATSDIEVFNAIFKSLEQHLLHK